MRRFAFAFDTWGQVLRVVGVTPATARVEVDEDEFRVRFGLWRLNTPRSNVAGASVGGPYRWWTGIGLRLSLADRGVTFGTAASRGVCVEFRTPVRGPFGPIRHPGATVTVDDPDGLVQALTS